MTARTRIAIGHACLLISGLLVAMVLRIVPDRREAILEGRKQLCEAIAINTSALVAEDEFEQLSRIFRVLVERNPEILSAGLRHKNGRLMMQVGDHQSQWKHRTHERSDDTQVYVPIRAGRQKWGTVEVRFQAIYGRGLLGFLLNPWTRLVLFLVGFVFVLDLVYLRKVLQHLDPAKAVPGRVRSALDTLAEGLLVIDDKERIVLANQAFESLVGTSAHELVGSRVAKLDWVGADGQPTATHPWTEALRAQSPQYNVMLGLRLTDSSRRTFLVNCSPVLGHDGNYGGVLISFDDVTQLEETKVALEHSKEAAETASQAKSEFLARMSHEIRTPMNAILGFTDMMRRGFDKTVKERQDYLNTIHASGEHLLALINDILDLSKIEAGRMELELRRCSPHEVISQVVSMLRSKADQKGIELDFECNEPLPETILTDQVRLRQTIMNLVGNAIKFTDQGSVRIVARLVHCPTVESDKANADGSGSSAQKLAIDVIDTGIGISHDVQENIFNPFSQADSSITRRYGGTGLGLAISRQLAQALGGEIGVTSQPNKGSTFTVTVDPGPLDGIAMVEAETALANRVVQEDVPPNETVQLPPARVLVADDGQSNCKLIELVLGRAGLEVVAVENGQLAVEMATHESFDLILMDMQMPVMDGYAATTTLRSAGYQGPIIALTAHAMQEDEEKCRAAGCSGFLPKPINIDRLLAALAEALAEVQALASIDACQVQQEGVDGSQRSPETPYSGPSESMTDPIECSLPLDDPDFRQIAEEFSRRLEEKLVAMWRAWQTDDLDELAALAHWLKGSGGTAGFDAFTSPATTLEELARQRNRELIPAAIQDLRQMARRIALPLPAGME